MMKTILVLTDFSKNSRNAAETALQLADKVRADILLFNVYSRFPFLPSAEFVAWPPEYYSIFKEESTFRIKKEINRLKKLLPTDRPDAGKITIHYLTAEGTIAECLPALLKKRAVTMLLMGGRERVAGNFLFGNTINDVLKKAICPVLIVSSKKAKFDITNIVFATDLDVNDIKAVKYLIELSKSLHFHLHVCHVSQPPVFVPDFNEEERITTFIHEMSKMNFDNLSYQNLEGDSIVKELDNFCRKTHADIFALVNKDHSIFWKILHKSPSKALIRHQKNPLLILPENWKYEPVLLSDPIKKVKKPRLQIL